MLTPDTKDKTAKELRDAYLQWEKLYKDGCDDPFWTDGQNLEALRNRIQGLKAQCEQTLLPKDYPKEYHRKTPPKVDLTYMAHADDIRSAAKHTLLKLRSCDDYFILIKSQKNSAYSKASKKHVISEIAHLNAIDQAIKEDDLLAMRRIGSLEEEMHRLHAIRKELEVQGIPLETLPEGQMSFSDLL